MGDNRIRASTTNPVRSDSENSLFPELGFLEDQLSSWFKLLKFTGFYPALPETPLPTASSPKKVAYRFVRTCNLLWAGSFVLASFVFFACLVMPEVIREPDRSTKVLVKSACKITSSLGTNLGAGLILQVMWTFVPDVRALEPFLRKYLKKFDRRLLSNAFSLMSLCFAAYTGYQFYKVATLDNEEADEYFVHNLMSVCGANRYRELKIFARFLYYFNTGGALSINLVHLAFLFVWLAIARGFKRLTDRLTLACQEELEHPSIEAGLTDLADFSRATLALAGRMSAALACMFMSDIVYLLYLVIYVQDQGSAKVQTPGPPLDEITEGIVHLFTRTAALIYLSDRAQASLLVLEAVLHKKASEKKRAWLFAHYYRMNTEPVVFSLGGIVMINRTFLATLTGIYLTYTVVILGLDPEGPKFNSTRWDQMLQTEMEFLTQNLTSAFS